jgi:osmotically inducible protein OsmC
MQTLYSAQARAVGGRDGHVETSDGLLKVDMSIPKSMGGPGRPATTNPEQLFAMGYAACFGGAVGFVAKQKKLEVGTIEVTADVHIGRVDPEGLGLGVALAVRVPGLARADAEALVAAAHQVCPYSKATRGNIEVTLRVVD